MFTYKKRFFYQMRPKIPLLLDLDGVLRIGKNLAPDAKTFFDSLQELPVEICIITNSTRQEGHQILKIFRDNYIQHKLIIITALEATKAYVMEHYQRVAVYCQADVLPLFEQIHSEDSPQAVVIGDLGTAWTYELLNQILALLMNGADLVAMQQNKYWYDEQGKLCLDAGAFVAALEYATTKKAILIGKPSKLFFQTALKRLGYHENHPFLMVGDDLFADVIPAKEMGAKVALCLTGKTTRQQLQQTNFSPDFVGESLTTLIPWLKIQCGVID